MSDAATRQRERVCAALGCVPGRAPVSTSGPLPLTLLAPRCERCGEAVGPDWRLAGRGDVVVVLEADGIVRVEKVFARWEQNPDYPDFMVFAGYAPTHGALTRWDERTAHASVGDVELRASV